MTAVRCFNGLSGLLLILAALAFLAFFPENLADYASEPEDVWLISASLMPRARRLCLAGALLRTGPSLLR
jgi:hypothetical protein